MHDLLSSLPSWPEMILVGTVALSILTLALKAKRVRVRHGKTEAILETASLPENEK